MNERRKEESNKNIVCLLSVTPCIKTYNFFKAMQLNTSYDVYIVIDRNDYMIPGYDGVVKIIQVDEKECEMHGFKSSVLHLNHKACSRDKALYYFSKRAIDFKYIWMVEQDVFIPTIYTLPRIDEKYKDHNADLLVRSHKIAKTKLNGIWHWDHVHSQVKIPPPYATSMISAIRCSKRMLTCVRNYARRFCNLFLDETMFNTLAIHNQLKVLCIPELWTIKFQHQWKFSDIKLENLYHPIKCMHTQERFRALKKIQKRKLLKFVHISKCGGTSIEDAGKAANILWGKFHQEYGSYWHQLFSSVPEAIVKKYDWFMVVRNPYDRILSEYYCRYGGIGEILHKHPYRPVHTKEQMNQYLIQKIKKRSSTGCHYTEQYKYLHPTMEIHLIKFENLQQEFDALMEKYDLKDIRLEKHNASPAYKRFSLADFSQELVDLIEETYAKDFETFGYPMGFPGKMKQDFVPLTIEESVIEEPVIKEPVIEEPAIEEPITDENEVIIIADVAQIYRTDNDQTIPLPG